MGKRRWGRERGATAGGEPSFRQDLPSLRRPADVSLNPALLLSSSKSTSDGQSPLDIRCQRLDPRLPAGNRACASAGSSTSSEAAASAARRASQPFGAGAGPSHRRRRTGLWENIACTVLVAARARRHRVQQSTRSAPANRGGPCHSQELVGVKGFEPSTPASRRQCSTRLSYTPMVFGCRCLRATTPRATLWAARCCRLMPLLVSRPSWPDAGASGTAGNRP